MHPLRIGVNALYLIPGGVGGTEIYLRALARRPGRDRPRQPLLRFHQSRNRRRPGAGTPQLHRRPAARPRRFAPGAHALGADRAAAGRRARRAST